MNRTKIFLVALALLAILHSAIASVSLSTGAVLPGWDQVRSGGMYNAASDTLRDYARQAGMTCGPIDVHSRSNASLISRAIYVDTWLESRFTLRDLLTARDHHVILLEPDIGFRDHLVLVIQVDRTLVLAAC